MLIGVEIYAHGHLTLKVLIQNKKKKNLVKIKGEWEPAYGDYENNDDTENPEDLDYYYEWKYNIYLFIENKIYLYLYLFEINEFHPNKQYCHFLANKQNLR